MSVPIPPRLYKFRTYGAKEKNGEDKKWLYDLLKGQLRFAGLSSFNDPFEGKPLVVPAYENTGAQKDAIVKYLIEKHFSKMEGVSPTKARRLAIDSIRGKSIPEMTPLIEGTMRSSLGSDELVVYCTSAAEAVCAPLVWSHYADQHRGVCIHFDSRRAPFKFAHPIVYCEKYPAVTFPPVPGHETDLFSVGMMQKIILWKYEYEYRMLRPTDGVGELGTLGVTWDKTVATAEHGAIVGVTFGALMHSAVESELTEWIRANRPSLELWKASLHERKYEIVSRRIS